MATANLLTEWGWSYTYTEVWNGEEWSVIAKTPDNTRVHLSGVSCTSSSNCVAVGHHTDESGEEITTLAWHWNGEEWTQEESPNGVGSDDNRFTDVSCVSTEFCMATANLLTEWGWSYTYTEIWNGEEWSVIAKTPDNTRVHLSGVSCTSSSNCVAVGHHTDESGEEITTLAWRYDGKKWIEQYTPNVDESNNELVGVSCTSTCAAVGSYTDGEDFWTLAQMRR
jgi:hypothetical protein